MLRDGETATNYWLWDSDSNRIIIVIYVDFNEKEVTRAISLPDLLEDEKLMEKEHNNEFQNYGIFSNEDIAIPWPRGKLEIALKSTKQSQVLLETNEQNKVNQQFEAELHNAPSMQTTRQSTRIQRGTCKVLNSVNSAILSIVKSKPYLEAVGDAVYDKQ